jgi:hypothetical protein
VILDPAGVPIKAQWRVWLTLDHGRTSVLERGMFWLNGAMFVFPNLNQTTFRMTVSVPGFQEFQSEPIRLEEGELRYLEVRLH